MKKFTQPAILVALGATVSFASMVPDRPKMLLPLEQQSTIQSDSSKKDSIITPKFKDLPLKAEREIKFNTKQGTWMSVDVSPDGKTLAFDLLGDIYTIPMEGGKATPVTTGMAYETHPRFSPDGEKILFTSDRAGSDNLWYIDLVKKDTVQITKDKNGEPTLSLRCSREVEPCWCMTMTRAASSNISSRSSSLMCPDSLPPSGVYSGSKKASG